MLLTVLAVPALVTFILLVEVIRRKPTVGFLLISLVVIVSWEFPRLPPLANIGESTVYPDDLIIIALAFSVLGGPHSIHKAAEPVIDGIVFVSILFGFAVIRGFSDSLATGLIINEYRPYLAFCVATIWSLQLARRHPTEFEENIRRFSIWLGLALVAVAVYHLARNGLGRADTFVDPLSGFDQTSRILTSGQAMMLVLCIFAILSTKSAANKHHPFIVVFLTSAVLLSQQRSVWVAALLALAAAVLRMSSLSRFRTVVVSALAASAAFVVITVFLPTFRDDIVYSITNRGTYDGRVAGWFDLISRSKDSGLFNISFGRPMGTGYIRFEGPGRLVNFAPHNWYVAIFLRTGLVGLAVLVAVVIRFIYLAWISPKSRWTLAIVVAILVYGWTYSWLWYSMPFIALCVVTAGVQRQTNQKRRRSTSNDREAFRV